MKLTSKVFDLRLLEAKWVLGLIHSEELPDIAATALTHGIESKSLIVLAGLNGSDTDEVRKLFEQALCELGCGRMEKIDAVRNYARSVSTAILESELAPLDGAKQIWKATLNAEISEFHELDAFIYAASELEDRPQDKALFEKAILQEATQWKKWRG